MIRLYATPLSHFARKIRVLLAELAIPFEMVRPDGLLGDDAANYGGNPLLRVPTLVHDDATIVDSDHIARYLVAQFDHPRDRFAVRSDRVADLNRLAAINGIMANEVTIILAKRGGLDISTATYFRKLDAAIERALAWLDADAAADHDFDYRDIALACMWQHVEHYASAPHLERYPRIAARVARFADRPSIASTTPTTSLAA